MRNRFYVFLGLLGLVIVYVFQSQLFYDPFINYLYNPLKPEVPEHIGWKFILSKALRYLLNDGFALLVIWGLFKKKKYIRFAVLIFFIGFLVLLPIYLFLALNYYIETQSFLNHLHRLVLNPVLMMLLIPAFYYQQSLAKLKPKKAKP
jgi:exosortase F-associated protein